tara:strand:+ start:113 stop:352 length:240 start_codon:yes stop_codon:yes gene_type:complete
MNKKEINFYLNEIIYNLLLIKNKEYLNSIGLNHDIISKMTKKNLKSSIKFRKTIIDLLENKNSNDDILLLFKDSTDFLI